MIEKGLQAASNRWKRQGQKLELALLQSDRYKDAGDARCCATSYLVGVAGQVRAAGFGHGRAHRQARRGGRLGVLRQRHMPMAAAWRRYRSSASAMSRRLLAAAALTAHAAAAAGRCHAVAEQRAGRQRWRRPLWGGGTHGPLAGLGKAPQRQAATRVAAQRRARIGADGQAARLVPVALAVEGAGKGSREQESENHAPYT